MDVNRILADLKQERQRLDSAIAALEGLGSGQTTRFSNSKGKVVTRKRRKMSAAARKKISNAAKQRWAKQKAAAK